MWSTGVGGFVWSVISVVTLSSMDAYNVLFHLLGYHEGKHRRGDCRLCSDPEQYYAELAQAKTHSGLQEESS